ncbi:MAG: T9SS type A sorting domain-containing protein [Flavobacteriales bacterium]
MTEIATSEPLIFPNPANNHIQIQWANQTCEPFEIINIADERLKQGQLCDTSSIVNIAYLALGIYFFKSEAHISRFVKMQ